MNIAELKDAIEDLDPDLELRVNLFNKVTVGVESVDFTTYVDSDEEIVCIVMEGDEEKTESAPQSPSVPMKETADTFHKRMGATEDSPAQAALAVDAANKPGGVPLSSLTTKQHEAVIKEDPVVDKEGDAQ